MKKFLLIVITAGIAFVLSAQNSTDSLLNLGIEKLDAGQYEAAAEYLKRFVQADSLNPKSFNCLGISYLKREMYDSAEIFMNKALELDTEYYAAYCNLSECYLQMGDIRRAEDNASIYLKNCPDSIGAYMQMAEVNFANDDIEKAIAQYDKAFTLDKNNEELYYGRCRLFLMTDSLELALKDAQKALKINESSRNYYLCGYIYDNMGNMKDAEKDYIKAKEKDVTNYRAWEMLGILYLNASDYDNAVKLAKEMKELTGENAVADYLMGYAYYFKGKYDEALKSSASGLAADSTLPGLYSLKGSAHLALNEYKEAINVFDKAIQMDPYVIYNYTGKAEAQLYLNTSEDILSGNAETPVFKDLKWQNLEKMKEQLSNQESDYYLKRLKEKLYLDFSVMGLDEYFMLYLGNSLDTATHSSFSINDQTDALYELMDEEKFEECITEGQQLLEDRYSSMKINYQIAMCYMYLGDIERAYEYFLKYQGFLKGICTSGDGKSFKTAYLVISVNDEYTILGNLGKQVIMQSLNYDKGEPFDLMETKGVGGNEETVYFNVSIVFEKYKSMFK
jgi:tetratricopeptide (TPR) repeat protein